MAEPGSSFISASWIKPLWKMLLRIQDERKKEIQKIKNTFTDPFDLARYYVEPNCQHHNPADHQEDIEPRSSVKSPVFSTINDFLEGEYAATRTGKSQFFILSDAGMGKSSLLVMLKLAHLVQFWPSRYDCVLLKLGRDTLTAIKTLENAGDTILLLDALDEDPVAWGNIQPRLIDLLTETSHFRRVIISCRTQFFPKTAADPFANSGRITLGGFTCPMAFLSLFDAKQVEAYLDKRYPREWSKWWRVPKKRGAASGLVKRMRDLSCRPMLLAHVEDLVDSNIQDWSEFAVYRAMVQAWLNREERKLREAGHSITSESLFEACKIVAREMSYAGSRFIPEERLHELMDTHHSLKGLTQITFGGRSLFNRNSDAAFRFSHFSIQEFVLACDVLANAREAIRVPKNASRKTIDFILAGRKFSVATEIVDFTDAILEGANFEGVDLEAALFVRAKLKGANFRRANCRKADFSGADLSNANFDFADLELAHLDNPIVGHPFLLRNSKRLTEEFAIIATRSLTSPDSLFWINPSFIATERTVSLHVDDYVPDWSKVESILDELNSEHRLSCDGEQLQFTLPSLSDLNLAQQRRVIILDENALEWVQGGVLAFVDRNGLLRGMLPRELRSLKRDEFVTIGFRLALSGRPKS